MKIGQKLSTRLLFIAVLVTMIAAMSMTAWGQQSTVLKEDFNYTGATTIAGQGGWSSHSGAGTNNLTVASGGLSYPGYAGDGLANALKFVGSGDDENKVSSFPSPLTGGGTSVYLAAMIRIDTARRGSAGTGDYFFHMYKNSSTFTGRLFARAKSSNASLFSFGVAKSSTAANVAYSDSIYSVGTTYLVVIKQKIIASTANDSVFLYINPVINGTEPTPTVTELAADVATTDVDTIYGVAVRQGSTATGCPSGIVDGIRLGNSWAGVVSGPMYRTQASGAWAAPATWQVANDGTIWNAASSTPTSTSDSITIQSGHTVDVTTSVDADQVTIASGGELDVDNGQTLTVNDGLGNDLTVAGTLGIAGTVNGGTGTIAVNGGTVQINQGGWGGSTNTYVYNATATLAFNNSSGSYGMNGDAYWPAVGGPSNVNNMGAGGLTMNVARSVATLFQTSSGVSSSGNLTINGTNQLNAGGFFDASPVYGAASTLQYSTGGAYGASNEWGTGTGAPANLSITTSTVTAPSSARTLTGNVSITGGGLTLNSTFGADLTVGGNWTRSAGTFTPSTRQVTFNGSTTQTVTATGGETFDYLQVNKAGGNLALANNATVNNTLTLTSGNIDAGANTVTIGGSGTVSRTSGHVIGNLQKTLGSYPLFFEVGTANGYSPATLTSGSGTGTMTIKATQGAHSPAFSSNALQRYWTLTNGGATSADLRFDYNQADVVGNEGNYDLRKYSGGVWTTPVGANLDTLNNNVRINGVTSFSDFTLAECPTISLSPNSPLPSGNQGVAYSQQITASGGQSPYTYAITSGHLQPGLSISSTGLISGTPTASGDSVFTVTATDTAGCTGSQVYHLVVTGCPVISITPASLPNGGGIGAAYADSVQASGGVGPYTFTVSAGALPGGLALDASGHLTGTFTADGTFNFTITATDANTCTGNKSYTFVVCQNMPLTAIPDGFIGKAYADTVSVTSGGVSPYSFAVTSGSLPTGLSLTTGGILSGTPTANGSYPFSITVTDSNGCTATTAYTVNITCPAVTVNPASLPGVKTGNSYNQTVTASGGTTPYAFTVTVGSLPTGLSLSLAGAITGTATTAGTYNFTVTATDTFGCIGTRAYTIIVGSPAFFTVAAGADTLYWDAPATWVIERGSSITGTPQGDDTVQIDHTHHAGRFVVVTGPNVTQTPSMFDSAKTIIVGAMSDPDTNRVELLIPQNGPTTPSGSQIYNLKFGDGIAGNYDFVIQGNGRVADKKDNFARSVSYRTLSDTMWIRTGGWWYHFTKGFNTMHRVLSRRFDGDYGTIEFDINGAISGTFDVSGGGNYWYPNVVFSNTHGFGTYYWFGTGMTTIKGTLTINPGAKDSMMLGPGSPFIHYGDIVNNGTLMSPTGALGSPIIMRGSSAQSIGGSTAPSLGGGLVIMNNAGVSLTQDVNMVGSVLQTSGNVTWDSTGTVVNVTYPATGVLTTGSSTVFLNPAGSLNEGTGANPIVGNVSATRTVNTALETFGSIGFEVTASSAPGVTVVNRKTGVASSGNGHSSIKRYFDVTPTNNSGLNATIGFSYAPSELNGITETNLLLQKSTDAGTTWSGRSGTVSTGLHKITATGLSAVQYRWTAADVNAPLFITHTIAIRKFADADGDPATTGDQTAKKWRLSLYRDSVSVSTLVNSANPIPGVMTTANLESGTYIAAEEDSLGWLNLATREHGTTLSGGLNVRAAKYDTTSYTDLQANSVDTVDFINQQVATITLRKFVNTDGVLASVGARRAWGLALYAGSVAPANLLASGNVDSLTVTNLQAGTFIAVEADSGASWVRLNGNHALADTFTVTAAQTLVDTFINFQPNTIFFGKLSDADGALSTTGDRVHIPWHLEVHQGSLGGPIVAQSNSGNDSISYLGDGTYYVVEADSANWVHLGYVLNGGNTGTTANSMSVALAAGQTAHVDFVNAPPIYSQKFRTFLPNLIPTSLDNKGKAGKLVVRKPDKSRFVVGVRVDSANVTGLHIEFGSSIDTAFALTVVPPDTTATTTDGKFKKYDFRFASALNVGDSVHLFGYAWANKGVKVSKYQFTRGGSLLGKSKKDASVSNTLCFPMPNRINALADAFSLGGFSSTSGLLVGKNEKTPNDSSKLYGWFQAVKYGDVLKSLDDKGAFHGPSPNTARPFDVFTSNGKPIKGQQKSLSANKQNNSLLADMIALKLNIAASALGMTTPGFGELVYNTGGGDPLDGLMLKEIVHLADSIMMGWQKDSVDSHSKPIKVHKFFTYDYRHLDSVINMVNTAFEGPIDTSRFWDTLRVNGTAKLIDVAFLHANPGTIPARIVPLASAGGDNMPVAYALYQNYPNPFNPSTTIQFDLPEPSIVTLKVYNILGQEVATLLGHQQMEDGQQTVQFNANHLATGVYFYRLTTEGMVDPNDGSISGSAFTTTKKMLLIK